MYRIVGTRNFRKREVQIVEADINKRGEMQRKFYIKDLV